MCVHLCVECVGGGMPVCGSFMYSCVENRHNSERSPLMCCSQGKTMIFHFTLWSHPQGGIYTGKVKGY